LVVDMEDEVVQVDFVVSLASDMEEGVIWLLV
jgi:hypothetical protein